jgi:hypothetical protein
MPRRANRMRKSNHARPTTALPLSRTPSPITSYKSLACPARPDAGREHNRRVASKGFLIETSSRIEIFVTLSFKRRNHFLIETRTAVFPCTGHESRRPAQLHRDHLSFQLVENTGENIFCLTVNSRATDYVALQFSFRHSRSSLPTSHESRATDRALLTGMDRAAANALLRAYAMGYASGLLLGRERGK